MLVKMDLKKEKSCGLVVFKNINNELNVLLVHHNKGHWGMPKGHVELNETEQETALRETLEETNVNSKVIDGFRKVITYSPKPSVIKDVVFFVGEVIGEKLKPQKVEVSEVKWINIKEALLLMEHDDEKQVLSEAIDFYINK